MHTLREIIEQHLPANARTNNKGKCPVVCRICHDHGNKGPRAAFIWPEDSIGYNCFNCGFVTKYNPNEMDYMPKKMIELLQAYDVADVDWLPFVKNVVNTSYDTAKQSNLIPREIQLPPYFYPITNDNSDWCNYAIEYLTNRDIDWTSQPFYLSTNKNKNWYGRLIIPIYYKDKIVSYIGRDLTDMHLAKYKSHQADEDNILFGYHNILAQSDKPIYVCEGWFDAYPINGVAVFKSRLSQPQISWLNRTSRPKVVIPDQYGKGHKIADQAIQLGWGVSFPFIDTDINDINSGIKRYGLFWVLKALHDNTKYDFEAKLTTQMYCK